MKKIFFLLTIVSMFAIACNRNESNTTDENSDTGKKTDKVKVEADALTDSMNYVWTEMIKSDDQKIKDIDRLLQEISYCKKYNVMEWEKLNKSVKELPALRYDAENMVSEKIDAYDAATDTLINRTYKLAMSTADIEQHTLVNTLMSDINTANGDLIISYRARYDKYAILFNSLLEKNEKQLQKLGVPYATFKKKLLFTLGA